MILILILLTLLIAWTAWHFWLILPAPAWGKWLFTALYLLSFLVIIPHFAFGDRMPLFLATATYEIGTSWMIFFIYAIIIFAVLVAGRVLKLIPASFLRDSLPGSITVLATIGALLVGGYFHYHHKYRQEIDITTDKPIEKPLTIVLASDLHVGYHNRKAELKRWVDLINAEAPDLVLFAGDIVDGSLRPVMEGNYADEFRKLKAPAFACLGNHEYIGGKEGSEAFYRLAGITLFRDSSAVVSGIRIAGRDDKSNPRRIPVADLLPSSPLFTLLLDHQPSNLHEAEEAGVDFQFSGHTHHGQIWPGNWLTDMMFEKAYGHHRRGATRYYISSGLGIWGGKFRIGTRSEYVVLKLHN